MEQCDIAIIGGGMVGALAAALLAPTGLQIRLVEAKAPTPFAPEQAPDLRVSSLSATSVRLLQQANAWASIMAMRAWPYQRLEAYEWQGFNTIFNAQDIDCAFLGYMVENRLVQLGLWHALAEWQNVHVDCPNGLTDLKQTEQGATLTLNNGQVLQAKLVLACDGAESHTRSFTDIGMTAWDYAQSCMLISMQGDALEPDTTWQQFTPSGPRAFLPLGLTTGSLVWYDQKHRIKALAELDNEALAEQVRLHFPDRMGHFKVLDKGQFALRRRHANQYFQGRVVLLGDAAHTINPLAGQGVNLGFKDAQALSDIIHHAVEGGLDFTDAKGLQRYQQQRRGDNLLMQGAMDVCYHTFSNDLLPLKILRNLGLSVAERSGPLKNKVMKYAMGL